LNPPSPRYPQAPQPPQSAHNRGAIGAVDLWITRPSSRTFFFGRGRTFFICADNKSIVSAEDIPKNIMDQLSVAEPTVETPSIKNLYILNPGSDTNDDGVVGFTCKPKMRDLPGTELSQISPLYPSTALTQILQHHNSRG
ncbi:MAG: hypothetical protein ACK48E_07950, partial [Holosporales bacterium]